jgi:EmrB/QacA subfamily drug resistance transporter
MRPAPRPEQPPAVRSHRQILVVMGGLMVAMLLPAMNMTLVATALPTIVGDLGGLSQLSWVITAYLLTSTVVVPLAGKVSDLYGRKPLFQLAIVVFAVGSVLSGMATSMGQLIVFRGLQGVGGGALMALTQAIIGDVVSPRQRGRYQGYLGAVFAFSSVAGPLLGGLFVDHLTWRWAFFVNVPLALVALWVTHHALRLPHVRVPHRIDFVGAALLVAAASSLLLVTVWGGELYPWTSPVILTLAFGGAFAAVAFIVVELRVAEPIVPLSLFRIPVFTRGSLIGLFAQASLLGALAFLPLYFQAVSGVSATASGLLLLPIITTMLVASIWSGRRITRIGRYRAFPIVGTGLLTAGFALLATVGTDSSLVVISVQLAVVGAGLGLTMQNVVLAVQNAAPVGQLGVATSGVQFFRMIGAAVGVAAFGALLNARLDAGLLARIPAGLRGEVDLAELTGDPTAIVGLAPELRVPVQLALSDGLSWIFALAAVLAAISFLLAWTLPEVPLRDDAVAAPPPASATGTGTADVDAAPAGGAAAVRRQVGPRRDHDETDAGADDAA